MLLTTWSIKVPSRSLLKRAYSLHHGGKSLAGVDIIDGTYATTDVQQFRKRYFVPEKPVLIRAINEEKTSEHKPLGAEELEQGPLAAHRWFTHSTEQETKVTLSHQHLPLYPETILPYELVTSSETATHEWTRNHGHLVGDSGLQTLVECSLSSRLSPSAPGKRFYRFDSPLSLFLEALRTQDDPDPKARIQSLYIAQAQIQDLPQELQDDLPIPRLVIEAGTGDVYDANIWLGIPPTYTPLHKDPNPNLFIQLAGTKRVRLYKPNVGMGIMRYVKQRLAEQQHTGGRLGLEDMMEGLPRDILHEVVWGYGIDAEGFEAVVEPGDALFIPLGWWHSFKSGTEGLTASVNWWFR